MNGTVLRVLYCSKHIMTYAFSYSGISNYKIYLLGFSSYLFILVRWTVTFFFKNMDLTDVLEGFRGSWV